MKKIILLLDAGDSRFLLVHEKNMYELPTICSNDLINIDKKIYKKYKIKIKEEIVIIEEKMEFCFVKCAIDDKAGYDKKIFKAEVINEMTRKVTNKFQKQRLIDLSARIALEMCNDAFWLEVITKTHDKTNNQAMKQLLFDFLAQFSSSFCNEVIIYKYGKPNDECMAITEEELKEMRKNYFKVCPTDDSKHIQVIMHDMGINFCTNDFNVVLFFNNGVLIDVNSRTWEANKKYDKYCHVILSPANWIKNLNFEGCEKLRTLCSMMTYQFVEILNQYKYSYKSYSLKRLFNNNLSKKEKIYIMQRIGLIKTVMFFTNIFSSGLQYSDKIIDSERFLLKVKASLICVLGDIDLKKIPFLNKMFQDCLKDIPDEFYPINRKCRNNLHYGFYNELSEHELEVLKKNQDIYLKYVVDEFEKQLTINFGFKYYFDLSLAKIQYWASHKNML